MSDQTETTPGTPWTWTDEAREAVLRSAWNVNPGEAWDDDWVSAESVLAALTPHVARLRAQVAEAEQRLADVLALHRPDGGVGGPGAICVECTWDFGTEAEDPKPHPCPTARAATAAPGEQR